jgi:tRNA pseudouridine38-40 synthase
MRTLKLTVSYDGTHYVGWQRQLNGLSIQQLVEEAFVPLLGAAPTVAGASRTDAGVHALGQVASLNLDSALPAPAIQRALNMRLPEDVRIVGAVEARLGFHARFHASGKSYRYRIATTPVLSPFDRWFVWHVSQPLETARMQRAAAALVGRHDFAAFQASGASIVGTVRTLERVEVIDAGGEVRVEIDGEGFLRHMVRTIAGTLTEIGLGQRPVEAMAEIVAAGDRRLAGKTAPALGLTLVSVKYGDITNGGLG